MMPLESIGKERAAILKEVIRLTQRLKELLQKDILGLTHGIEVLKAIRRDAYEDLNQLPHASMILDAADDIQDAFFKGQALSWKWNAKQTGLGDEPDLMGFANGSAVVSAEITTSDDPQGSLDSRMRDTLKKLEKCPGRHFYFVDSRAMDQRARTKITNLCLHIDVRIAKKREAT